MNPPIDENAPTDAATRAAYERRVRSFAERYFAAWPTERDAILTAHRTAADALTGETGLDAYEIARELDDIIESSADKNTITQWPPAMLAVKANTPVWRRLVIWLFSEGNAWAGPLGAALRPSLVSIFTNDEIASLETANTDLLRTFPPVTIEDTAPGNEDRHRVQDIAANYGAALIGYEPKQPSEMPERVHACFEQFRETLLRGFERPPLGHEAPEVRAAYRAFATTFYTWYSIQPAAEKSRRYSPSPFNHRPMSLPIAQPTWPEGKRLAQGIARGPDGDGWVGLPGEFALIHTMERAAHDLRLEGALMPPWWGRPSDNDSLLRELKLTGADGIATFYNAIGLVLLSDEGHVDVEIDDLIERIGMDPRSRAQRADCRLQVWRILNVLSAVRVVGQRRMKVRDRVTRKVIAIESDDPLLTVSAWRAAGTQASFDVGTAPIAVTIAATPWLAKWRHNRTVLTDFGSLLRVTQIPIGQPSGAWARAVGFALQQFWREQATHAQFPRVGDGRGEETRTTARFRPVTRRELLELFPPQPSAAEILNGAHPSRAIEYWDVAIAELKRRGVIGHCASSRDWSAKSRPRKNWATPWFEEPLDIRPARDDVQALKTIANSAKRQSRRS